jgi:GNAT superfamily N-acetyltransferase
VRVERHADPAAFAAVVTPLLLRDEARYNLLLAIVGRLVDGDAWGDEPPVLLSLHDGPDGDVVGAAVMTPPFHLIADAVPPEHAAALVDWLVAEPIHVPGTIGGAATTTPLGDRLCALTGRTPRLSREEGLYRLTTLVPPRPVPGALRPTTAADADLVDAWDRAFHADVDLELRLPGRLAERAGDGVLWLWEDGGPVCLVGCGGYTPNGARIGPVYTPREHRGRGYASAATAAVSELLLQGRSYCFLYTDLANATSNKIYRDIGYEQLAQVREVAFDG